MADVGCQALGETHDPQPAFGLLWPRQEGDLIDRQSRQEALPFIQIHRYPGGPCQGGHFLRIGRPRDQHDVGHLQDIGVQL